MNTPHISVLLNELSDAFEGRHLKYFVDATLGAGGHSEAILTKHPEIELLIGFDQDPLARDIAKKRLSSWNEKIHLIPKNFVHLKDELQLLGISSIDGIIFDLGVSSMQFDLPEKGFSFMRNGPLDMRMDPNQSLTAFEIINTWTEGELGRIFREYGEEKLWKQAARTIVAKRKIKPIESTLELASILNAFYPIKKKGIHPATLIFQALRICVNSELQVLEAVLPDAIELLNTKGILGVISFHSLEDRIVKNTLRFAASDKFDTVGLGGVFLDKTPTLKLLTRKPIESGEEEISKNPRSRSAKMRLAEKK